jgi:hypothetical protein
MKTIVWKLIDKKGGYLAKSNRGDKVFVLGSIENCWTFCENLSMQKYFKNFEFNIEFTC